MTLTGCPSRPLFGDLARYCYYGLAQAAGLDYYTVEPPLFGWGAPGINPDPRDVLDILEVVLKARGYK